MSIVLSVCVLISVCVILCIYLSSKFKTHLSNSTYDLYEDLYYQRLIDADISTTSNTYVCYNGTNDVDHDAMNGIHVDIFGGN